MFVTVVRDILVMVILDVLVEMMMIQKEIRGQIVVNVVVQKRVLSLVFQKSEGAAQILVRLREKNREKLVRWGNAAEEEGVNGK
jgi:hypothetical protein